MPLLAVYTQIKKIDSETEFIFIGTKKSELELKLLQGYALKYYTINGGKFRRYFDFKNITDVFLTFLGFWQAVWIIIKEKPDVIVGAGGFISVPVIWAGWTLQKKILIHQQDIKPSFSNILTTVFAHKISVTFEATLKYFPSKKTIWTGNPAREDLLNGDKERAYIKFPLNKKFPVVLIMGGGTGAQSLNTITNQSLPELVKFCQVVHLTGSGKHVTGIEHENYQQYEFINKEMPDLLAAADIVVSRAGLSSLTELSVLGKPSIIIPMPDSHQEKNANYYSEKEAALVIYQQNLSPKIFIEKISNLLKDPNKLNFLSDNIKKMILPNAVNVISTEILKINE